MGTKVSICLPNCRYRGLHLESEHARFNCEHLWSPLFTSAFITCHLTEASAALNHEMEVGATQLFFSKYLQLN